MVDKAKGDKIKSAIANKGKSRFERVFEESSLSKSPGNSITKPYDKSGTNPNYEIGTKPSGGGGGFREDLEYVAGVASRAAKESAALRGQGLQNASSHQTNVDRINRENAVADRNFAVEEQRSQRASDRSNARMDTFNANARADAQNSYNRQFQSNQSSMEQRRYRESMDSQRHQNAVRENQASADRANQMNMSWQEKAASAAQLAAQMKLQRNNQLLGLARGGL